MVTEVFNIARMRDVEKRIDLDRYRDSRSVLIQIFSGQGEESLHFVSQYLSRNLPEAIVIGSTTDGEITNKRVSVGSIAISITVFQKTELKGDFIADISDSFSMGVILASGLISWDTKLLILFTDGLQTNGEEFLKGVESVNHFIPVAGGMAGDNAQFKQTSITYNGQTFSRGAVGVALSSEDLRLYTNYNFNWKPIGRKLKITKANQNRVYTLDDMEAGKVYQKYLGNEVYEKLPATGIEFPLIVVDKPITIARAVLSINRDDNSLIFAGNVKEGDYVQFGVGNVSMILKDSMVRGLEFKGKQIETFFIYSCMARRRLMPDNIYAETEFFAQIAPTSGFFTYGEFYHRGESNELLNQSMTVVALSENSEFPTEEENFPTVELRDSREFSTMKALSHLIDVSTKELLEYQKGIKDNLVYLDTVVNNISDLIITTNGRYLIKANKSFYNYFRVEDDKDFHKSYNCVCDAFIEDNSKGYIGKYIDGVLWTDYIYYNSNLTHKAKIRNSIFQVKVTRTDIQGEKTYIVILNSITEFENKELKLQDDLSEKLSFIDHLVDTLPIPFFYKDEKFRYQRVNRGYLDFTGLQKDEVIGRTVYDVYNPELAKHYAETDQELMNQDVQIFESKLQNQKGVYFDVIFYKSSVFKSDGSFNGIMGVILDITSRKSTEQQLLSFKKQITDSIEYASNIQKSIVPSPNKVREFFKDAFVCWYPRDKVGGDIYLFHEFSNRNEAILMVIDCTGHGVYGAFITMLVKAIERQVISQLGMYGYIGPSDILKIFNKKMKEMAKNRDMRGYSDIGFDGGVVYINKRDKIVRFAGASTSLFLVEGNSVNQIKGTRASVGYQNSDENLTFREYGFKYEDRFQAYITTDGYLDQVGGEKGFSYGKNRFRKLLQRVHNKRFHIQRKEFRVEMERWRGGEATVDDITVIGFEL